MTSRETRHQKILRIVSRWVAAKRRIGGCQYRGLSGSRDRAISLVGRVGLCALPLISRPRNLNLIVVLLHDLSLEPCRCIITLPSRISHSDTSRRSRTRWSQPRLAAPSEVQAARRFAGWRGCRLRQKCPTAVRIRGRCGGTSRRHLRLRFQDFHLPAADRRFSERWRWPYAWRLQCREKKNRAAAKCSGSKD